VQISSPLYDLPLALPDGSVTNLAAWRESVLLIVNTASECGFTPQYAALQTLQNTYAGRLRVLAFPCNQFRAQEPGDDQQIATFCAREFRLTFPVFKKILVNGEQAAPLYRWLCAQAPGILGTRAIKWNFTKFLIAPNARSIWRFAPFTRPEKLVPAIERLLEDSQQT